MEQVSKFYHIAIKRIKHVSVPFLSSLLAIVMSNMGVQGQHGYFRTYGKYMIVCMAVAPQIDCCLHRINNFETLLMQSLYRNGRVYALRFITSNPAVPRKSSSFWSVKNILAQTGLQKTALPFGDYSTKKPRRIWWNTNRACCHLKWLIVTVTIWDPRKEAGFICCNVRMFSCNIL